MTSVHDWQSYQASVLAQLGGGTAILYRPCREHPTRVTDCAPDDSVRDHERVAVISGPGFTGLRLVLLCSSGRSGCLGYLLVSALRGEESLLVKLLTGFVPAVQLFEHVPGNDRHRLGSGHLGFILLSVVDLAVKLPLPNQGQGDHLQYFSEQSPSLFADFVLALVGATLPGSEVEAGVAHELAPIFKIGEGACFPQEPSQVFVRNHLRCGRRDIGILFAQSFQYLQHMLGDLLLPVSLLEIVGQKVIEVHLQHLDVACRHFVQGGACRVVPESFERVLPDSRRLPSHLSAEQLEAVFGNPVWVAAILLDQRQTGVAVEEVLFERVVAEQLDHDLGDPAAQAGDGNIAFVVDFVELSEHQVVLADQAELDHLVELAQGADDPRIFLVGLVAVVGFHHAELGNRLGVDITGEKSQAPSGTKQAVLVLATVLADDPQGFSAIFLGDIVITVQPFLDESGAVAAFVAELFAVDFKEETQSVLVDVHGDIDNVIEVDFLGSAGNFHSGFSFCGVDSTGCERQPSYCTSASEGEAFLFAA